ncbi:MAG: exosortase/archaeosortase family protein [Planctomycetota bacterium]|nr:exosortase/archaeosortase family protein [Planctomycetota bacterium]
MAPQIWENSLPHTTEPTTAPDSEAAISHEVSLESRKSTWQHEGLWLVLALAFLAFLYRDVFVWLSSVWANNADYSHGFLVPVFAAYILWSNRGSLRSIQDAEPTGEGMGRSDSGFVLGGALIGLGLLTRVAGIYMRLQTLEGISLIPFVLGIITILFGRRAARWGAPAVFFLLFMIPLPSFLSGQLSGLLQTVATHVSTFAFQILGIPAFAEGNVISLSNGQIGVAEACSGLRMLYAFFALTAGACMIIDRSWPEKALIALTAIPIAIIANCIRIIATGLAFEYLDAETAEHIFHDVAGWLMMPLGFTILLGALSILDRLIVPDDRSTLLSGLNYSK